MHKFDMLIEHFIVEIYLILYYSV